MRLECPREQIVVNDPRWVFDIHYIGLALLVGMLTILSAGNVLNISLPLMLRLVLAYSILIAVWASSISVWYFISGARIGRQPREYTIRGITVIAVPYQYLRLTALLEHPKLVSRTFLIGPSRSTIRILFAALLVGGGILRLLGNDGWAQIQFYLGAMGIFSCLWLFQKRRYILDRNRLDAHRVGMRGWEHVTYIRLDGARLQCNVTSGNVAITSSQMSMLIDLTEIYHPLNFVASVILATEAAQTQLSKPE